MTIHGPNSVDLKSRTRSCCPSDSTSYEMFSKSTLCSPALSFLFAAVPVQQRQGFSIAPPNRKFLTEGNAVIGFEEGFL